MTEVTPTDDGTEQVQEKPAAPAAKTAAAELYEPGTETATAVNGEATASEVTLAADAALYVEEGMPFFAEALARLTDGRAGSTQPPDLSSVALTAEVQLPPADNLDDATAGAGIPSERVDESGNRITIAPVPEGGEPAGGVTVTTSSTLSDGSTGDTVVNTYNADGQIESTVTTSTNAEDQSQRQETVRYSLDDNGQIASSVTTIEGGNGEDIGVYSSVYGRDAQGRIISETTTQQGDDETPLGSETKTFEYDDDGNIAATELTQTGPNGDMMHSERTTYDAKGSITNFYSTDVDGEFSYSSSFSADENGDIVRTDVVAQNPPPGDGTTGIVSRSTTTTHRDGSTDQVYEYVDPKTGQVTDTQTTKVRTDGSILMTSTGGEGGRLISTEYPPGTAQRFSESGTLEDGVRNMFVFGDGNISRGIVHVQQIGLTVENPPPGASPLDLGFKKLNEYAKSSTNPNATIDSVLAAIGEFGREADNPLAKRPNASEGVKLMLEMGKDADKTITDLTSLDGTLYYSGDGSAIGGMFNIQHRMGDGSANRTIVNARLDGNDGTFQGGLKEYGRFAPTMNEALNVIDRADPTSHSFSADRAAIIALDDPGGQPSAFSGGADNIARADDTPGDNSLSSGMTNLLDHGNGSLYTAAAYLRGSSEDGRVESGIANTRYASDNGSFSSGSLNMKDAGNGNPVTGYEYFKRVSDNGTFQDGVDNTRSVSDDGKVSTGINNLERMSPNGNDMAAGGEIVKVAGGGSFDQGATNIRALSDTGRFVEGSDQLKTLGGGSYSQGATNLEMIGGGNPTEGVRYLKEIGNGSAQSGIQVFANIGGGDANKGVQLAAEAGGSGPNAVQVGMEKFQKLGNGNLEAGAQQYVVQKQAEQAAAAAAADAATVKTGGSTVVPQGQAYVATSPYMGSTFNRGAYEEKLNSLLTKLNSVADQGAIDTARIPPYTADGALLRASGEITTDSQGRRVDAQGRHVDADGRFINAEGRLVDSQGRTVDAQGRFVDSQGRVVDSLGRIVNSQQLFKDSQTTIVGSLRAAEVPGLFKDTQGRLVDAQGRVVDAQGRLVDAQGRPVDSQGRPIDSQSRTNLVASIAVNVRGAEHPSVVMNGLPNTPRNFGSGEVMLSKTAAGAGNLVGYAQFARVPGADSASSSSTSNSVRSTFSYRGPGGAEVTVVRLADGRVMIISRPFGQRGVGFTVDGATIASGTALTRRFPVKGGDNALLDAKKLIIFRPRRKFKKRKLIGVEIALAVLLASAAVARNLDGRAEPSSESTSDQEKSLAKQSYAALSRPTWLVRPNEDLVKLAQHLFHEGEVGWLIADLNAAQIKDTYIEGKRVVELKERQKIELPVWQDIVEFHKNVPRESCRPEDLITVVTENTIDTELIHAALAPVMGITKPSGKLSPAAARVALPQAMAPESSPALAPVFVDSDAASVSLIMARRAAIAVVRAANEIGRKDDDQGPSAGAVVTRKIKRLRPKFIG